MLSLYLEMVHYFLTLLNPGQEYQVGFLGNFSEEEKNEPFDITIMVKNITDEYVETETALKWGSEKEDFIGTGRLQINHDRKNGLMKQMTGVLKYSMNKIIIYKRLSCASVFSQTRHIPKLYCFILGI